MKYRINIHLIQIFLLTVVIVLIGLAIIPLRITAKRSAESIKNTLITQFEKDYDIRIRYDSISPTLLSAVNVKNIQIYFPQGEFAALSFRIVLNPFISLRQKDKEPLRWITRITVSNAQLNINLDESRSIEESTFDIDIIWTMLRKKTLIVQNMKASFFSPLYGEFIAENVNFQLGDSGNRFRYRLSSTMSNETSSLDMLKQIGGFSTDFSSTGSFSAEGDFFNGRVNIEGAAAEYFQLKPLSVDYTLKDGKFSIRKIDDKRPVNLLLNIDSESTQINGEFVDLRISDILEPSMNSSNLLRWFNSTINGAVSLEFDANSSALNYEMLVTIGLEDNLMGRVDASGDRTKADIRQLVIDFPWASARYSGSLGLETFNPSGRLAIEMNEEALGYPLKAMFQVETVEGVITAVPDQFYAGSIEFHDFQFLAMQENQQFLISLLAEPRLPNDIYRSRLIFDAMLELDEEPKVVGFASIEEFETSDIFNLLNMGMISGIPQIKNTVFSLDGSFEANIDSWNFNVASAELFSKENTDNRITAYGSFNPDTWSLDSLKSDWNGFSLDARALVEKTQQGGIAEGRINVNDEMFPVEGAWIANGPITIRGQSGIDISIGADRNRGRRVSIDLENFTIPLNSGQLTTDLRARGKIGVENWNINLQNAQFSLINTELDQERNLDIQASIGPGNFDFPLIKYSDMSGMLLGNAAFEQADKTGNLKGSIELLSDDSEYYTLNITQTSGLWDAEFHVNSGQLLRLGRENTQGTVDIEGRFTGTVDDPVFTLEVSTDNVFVDGSAFELSGHAEMASGKLRIHELTLLQNGILLERGLILMNIHEGMIKGTAELKADYNQIPVSTGFTFGITIPEIVSLRDFQNFQDLLYSGTLITKPILWNEKAHLPGFTFYFEKNENDFSVRTPDNTTLNVLYQFESGKLDVLLNDPMPIVVQGGGTIINNSLDLDFPKLEVDPVLINYIMIRDPILLQYHVVFQGGRFMGNLAVSGPTSAPGLNGIIQAVNLKVDTPYTSAEILPASTKIHFEGNRISFDRIEVPVGGGWVYGEGYFELDAWQITDFDMNYGCLASSKSEGVPVAYPLLGVYLEGLATGNVHMTGNHTEYFLEADLYFPTLKASLIAPVIPVNQRRSSKRPTPVLLDFRINTGNNCTFFLPNEQLKIVRAIAEPNRTLKLLYDSSPKDFSLSGTLPLKSGNIYYFDRDFQITEGEMEFSENLDKFDPYLRLRAETRVRDEENEEVTVALVYNAPIRSDFNPSIETVPARSEVELLALFGRAVVPYGEDREQGLNSVLLATSGVFAQVGLVQPFEEVLREGLNLDIVTIRTDIIENALAGSINRSIDTGISEQDAGLGRFLDNTSLFAGKYIGNALFVSGSLSARYLEGQRLRSVFGGLEFETAISFEMATPFFNVSWSYNPDPLENRNFVADNTISLQWQFTY